MRNSGTLILAAAIWLTGSSAALADVELTIQNGHVSLVAREATVRQILVEWARVGQTKIVNGDRVPGGPVTLQLTDVPEQQALDILLRSVSGFMAAPRAIAIANASRFDRIVVMPTSVAPATSAARNTPAAQVFPQGAPALVGQPGFPQQPDPGDQDEDAPAPSFPAPNRGPGFNMFPQPQVVNPQTGGQPTQGGLAPPQGPLTLPPPTGAPSAAPAAYPNSPTVPSGGSAVPGTIVQPPAPSGQPQPGSSAQPSRRSGGNQ
jgi:hypothetical protein